MANEENLSATTEETELLDKELGPATGTQTDATGQEAHDQDLEDDDDPDAGSARRDTELESAASEEEANQIRAARREERQSRNRRRREKMETLERTADDLRSQLAQAQQQIQAVSHQTLSMQVSFLDRNIQEAKEQRALYLRHAEEAISKGDGRAIQYQDHAAKVGSYIDNAEAVRARLVNTARPSAPAMDPQIRNRANDFMSKHKWYRPGEQDEDSEILHTLDNAVARAGFDPRTPAYWDELEARGAKFLPHRFSKRGSAGNGENGGSGGGNTQRRSPVAGSNGNNRSGSGGQETYRLSAERVAAMKESGAWDDPKRRADMIRRYKETDAANKN